LRELHTATPPVCQHLGPIVATIPGDAVHCGCPSIAVYHCERFADQTVKSAQPEVRDLIPTWNHATASYAGRQCAGCPAFVTPTPSPSPAQRLILSTNLCPGDLLTLTAAIESLHATYPGEYLTDVRTNHAAIWTANPRITPTTDCTPGARKIEMHYPSINRSNQVTAPFLGGYTEYLGQQLGRPLSLTTNRPHLYLTPEEAARPRSALWPGAPDLTEPYWLVNAGIKSDYTCKQWPVEHYQKVVHATAGLINWVQIGLPSDNHPRLAGVRSLIDAGGPPMRELILLAYHAACGLGPVTFLQHLMAAWSKPYICLVGGREPATWVQYPLQHTLHTIGQMDCCRHAACWRGRVVPLGDGQPTDSSLCERPVTSMARPVPECLRRIYPEEVLAILRREAGCSP
jgi:ADP-heptose:LPS heptosyltransferase